MKFVIRRNVLGTISGLLPAATAMPMGTALAYSAKDPATGENTFALATGKFNGFVNRDVRLTAGLTDTEHLRGYGLETPYEAGKSGSIELAKEVEVEGDEFILGSGTGEITAATAVATKLSFVGGKFRVAQSADYAYFKLVKQMTPTDGGACRLYVEAIDGILVP